MLLGIDSNTSSFMLWTGVGDNLSLLEGLGATATSHSFAFAASLFFISISNLPAFALIILNLN